MICFCSPKLSPVFVEDVLPEMESKSDDSRGGASEKGEANKMMTMIIKMTTTKTMTLTTR